MATEGISAIGTVVTFNGNVLGEIETFDLGAITINIHEILTADSTDYYADAIGGALNSGEATFGMIFDPTSGGNLDLLKDDAEARTKGTLLITFPNTSYITGDAIISTLELPKAPEADAVWRFNVTLKKCKKHTYTAV
jgi:hypothetical protein